MNFVYVVCIGMTLITLGKLAIKTDKLKVTIYNPNNKRSKPYAIAWRFAITNTAKLPQILTNDKNGLVAIVRFLVEVRADCYDIVAICKESGLLSPRIKTIADVCNQWIKGVKTADDSMHEIEQLLIKNRGYINIMENGERVKIPIDRLGSGVVRVTDGHILIRPGIKNSSGFRTIWTQTGLSMRIEYDENGEDGLIHIDNISKTFIISEFDVIGCDPLEWKFRDIDGSRLVVRILHLLIISTKQYDLIVELIEQYM